MGRAQDARNVAAVNDRDRAVLRDEVTRQLLATLPLVLLLIASSPRVRLWWQLKLAALTRVDGPADADGRRAMRQLRRDLSEISNADLRGLIDRLELEGDPPCV